MNTSLGPGHAKWLVLTLIACAAGALPAWWVSGADPAFDPSRRPARDSSVDAEAVRSQATSSPRLRLDDISTLASGTTLRRGVFNISRAREFEMADRFSGLDIELLSAEALRPSIGLIHVLNGVLRRFRPLSGSGSVSGIQLLLVDRIWFDRDACNGFNFDATVLIAVSTGRDSPRGWWEVRDTLIHEISEVLLRRNSRLFDAEKWRACLPPEFEYAGPKRDRACLIDQPTWDVAARGFTTPYAMRTLSDDFGEFSVAMFTRYSSVQRWSTESIAIREKAAVATQFYGALSDGFCDDFFESFAD